LSDSISYAPYRALLQRALISRLLSQLSQVYSSIKITNLLALVAPLKDAGLEGAYDEEQVEAYVMGCARRGELNIKVDHGRGCITFVDDAFVGGEEPNVVIPGAAKEVEIQRSTADLVRTRLSTLAVCLHNSLLALEKPPEEEPGASEEKFKVLVVAAEAERKGLQLRRALVARRRELLSELSVRKEKEETSRRAEISRKEKEEEGRKAREDVRRREMERAKKEFDSIRVEEAKKLAQSLTARGLKGVEVS
jgi:translation initiation factor 3 subunit A